MTAIMWYGCTETSMIVMSEQRWAGGRWCLLTLITTRVMLMVITTVVIMLSVMVVMVRLHLVRFLFKPTTIPLMLTRPFTRLSFIEQYDRMSVTTVTTMEGERG